jgi:hypothetical protein
VDVRDRVVYFVPDSNDHDPFAVRLLIRMSQKIPLSFDYDLAYSPDCANFASTRNGGKCRGQLHQFASAFSRHRAF